MATFNYQASAQTALDLIKRFGTQATISRVESTYDEVEGEDTITAVNTTNAQVVNLPASESLAQQFEDRLIEQYKKGKIRFFYVAAKGLDFAPESLDLLFYESKVWELEGATGLNPAGTPIYYIIAVKASALTQLPTV